jgi:hypothetical protein
MTDDREAAENRILDDYLSEPVQDRTTLERYLLLYPMHADALHDLHFSLLQHSDGAAIADQAVDAAWVDTAVARMRQRLDATPKDPFQGLTPAQLTEIREEVGIRAGTLAGFRDRLVDAATVPKRVLQQHGRISRLFGASSQNGGEPEFSRARQASSTRPKNLLREANGGRKRTGRCAGPPPRGPPIG